MRRFILLVLLFGVIDCHYAPPWITWNGYGPMGVPFWPQLNNYNSEIVFDNLFNVLAQMFTAADITLSELQPKAYNAIDVYTAKEYKRIYTFEDCDERRVEILKRNRVIKVSAQSKSGVKLRDIVILTDNLQTQHVTFTVDDDSSKLIISIPREETGGNYFDEGLCPSVDMSSFLR